MTKSMLLAEFMRLPSPARVPMRGPPVRGLVLNGLSGAIDAVAARAVPTHRFLRYQWFAAALATYGGTARTIVVEDDGPMLDPELAPVLAPVLALPLVGIGPAALRVAGVPGCYWPFRSFPVDARIGPRAVDTLLDTLGRAVNALRIGPVCDGDPALAALLPRAWAKGWAVLDRFVADTFLLDLTKDAWPRGSTLRKNRFQERHLAGQGALDWRFLGAADWGGDGQDGDGQGGFDAMAAVEEKSWIAARTDGRDAKFTQRGHGAFWREAARDPVLAGMLSAALLTVDGAPAAFAFDLDCGGTKYAIANSYDPAFARQSPGKLLCYRNLVRAREQGIGLVDWGAGDSGYKQTIGAVPGPALRDWLLVRPGLPATLARMLRWRWAASGQGGR